MNTTRQYPNTKFPPDPLDTAREIGAEHGALWVEQWVKDGEDVEGLNPISDDACSYMGMLEAAEPSEYYRIDDSLSTTSAVAWGNAYADAFVDAAREAILAHLNCTACDNTGVHEHIDHRYGQDVYEPCSDCTGAWGRMVDRFANQGPVR